MLDSPHVGAHPGGHFGGLRAIILVFQLPHDVSHPVRLREPAGSIDSLLKETASNFVYITWWRPRQQLCNHVR